MDGIYMSATLFPPFFPGCLPSIRATNYFSNAYLSCYPVCFLIVLFFQISFQILLFKFSYTLFCLFPMFFCNALLDMSYTGKTNFFYSGIFIFVSFSIPPFSFLMLPFQVNLYHVEMGYCLLLMVFMELIDTQVCIYL